MKIQNEKENEEKKESFEDKKIRLEKIIKLRELIGDDIEPLIEILNKLNLSSLIDDNSNIDIKKIVFQVILKYKDCKDLLWKLLDSLAIDEEIKPNKWKLSKIKTSLQLILMDETFKDLFIYTQPKSDQTQKQK